MASFFEPDAFLFDPTSYNDESPSSFLSFSSFSDLASSPFDFSSWDYGVGTSKKQSSTPHQTLGSITSSSSPLASSLPNRSRSDVSASDTSSSCDPFEVIEAAFEPLTPAGEIGIFVNPGEKRLNLSSAAPSSTTASSSSSSSVSTDPRYPSSSHSYRSSTSSDTWDDPMTPGLSARSSIESFASTSTLHPSPIYKTPVQQPYSWDDASAGLGSGSAPLYTSPVQHQAHRTASNPVLSPNSTRPRVPRPIASMPALKEEDAATPSQWFDGTEQLGVSLDFASIGSASLPSYQQDTTGTEALSLEVSDDLLVDDFDWVFGEYGLGMAEIPAESTIFAAFQNNDDQNPSSTSHSSSSQTDSGFNGGGSLQNAPPVLSQPQPVYLQQLQQQQQPPQQQTLPQDQQQQTWLPTPAMQDNAGFPSYDFSSTIASMPSFTIDPMTLMAPPMGGEVEEPSRPSSAPGFNGGEGSGQLLSVQIPGQMTRSISSDGFAHMRHAPAPRDLFSYAPQQIPAGPHIPQPLYTTDPSPSYVPHHQQQHQQYALPMSPASTQSHSHHGRRASVQGLSVQIHPTMYSSYNQSTLPPTPQSAPFGTSGGEFAYQQQQALPPRPVQMARADTQPLPRTRKLSGSENDQSNVPAHILRAQAIVQMQEAKEEAQRQEYRRQAVSRRVDMSQASVMQPHPPRAQIIMGWEGPSAQTGSLPVLTTTPLVTIHPPPTSYGNVHQNFNVAGNGFGARRVHPPPHPGPAPSSRPISRLPSSPVKSRKVSASPKKSPAGKKRSAQAPAAGGFSWGETTFINFTPNDAEKLLTGVAPSGSQGKRKRDEDLGKSSPMKGATSVEGEIIPIEMERDRSKRSRSNE